MRRKGCIYVDKTAYMHRMISDPGTSLYFLSRPRRFGKSLMISTLRAIFEGRRELFDGLAISQTDWKWEKFPVMHFSFADVDSRTIDKFENAFPLLIQESLEMAGYAYDEKIPPADNFRRAIDRLASHEKGVVILIDEYDAPVAHALQDSKTAEEIRSFLANFYIQMKERTGKIRFLMMTGVSKFTKMSVFSALNNIVDVSMRSEYATMLGYTEDELTANFEPHLREHARRMAMEYDDYRAELKRWYNGFRFSRFNSETVYSPISVALALTAMEPEFSETWTDTGRPSMLMNLLKREDLVGIDMNRIPNIGNSDFDVSDLYVKNTIGMLYQSGYLTIKDYNRFTGTYTLGVPDEEIRRDLSPLITAITAGKDTVWATSIGNKLLGGDWDGFFTDLKSLYAGLPYGSNEQPVHEYSFQRILCTLLAAQGIVCRAECVQSDGRADVIAEHTVGIYIFELKVDEPVDKAFAQIEAKRYAEPYKADGRPIWLIALSFDRQTRRLVDHDVRQGNNGA